MNIGLVILKNGTYLIAQTEQLDYEPSVHLIDPYAVSGKAKLTLTRWPEYTDENHVLLRSDDVLTACEPSQKLMDAYASKVKLQKPEEPVILTEEVPEIFDDDTYEPRYVEE